MYFLIILDVWDILIIYEVSRFDCSFKLFRGCFGHFRGFGVILVILEIFGLFWSIKWLKGFFFFFFWHFGNFGYFGGYIGHYSVFKGIFVKISYTFFFFNFLVRITKIAKKLSIPQNTLRNAKMTKMYYECPKYPKNQENDQNTPKTSKTTTLPPPPPPKKNF